MDTREKTSTNQEALNVLGLGFVTMTFQPGLECLFDAVSFEVGLCRPILEALGSNIAGSKSPQLMVFCLDLHLQR